MAHVTRVTQLRRLSLAQRLKHVPYRDSGVTKLLEAGLGGQAAALHLLHVRLDEYGEAEASLALGIKLNALPVRPLTDGWWRPRAELEAARNSVQVRGGP